jgi:NAD(P)-dependent dehydrogenase (short-subunit alcohol dehydrogenase family)
VIRESLRELAALRRRTPFRAAGKVVVITGGAGGIGSALARRLAGDGASIVVVDRDEPRAKQVTAGLPTAADAPHQACVADLTDRAAIADLMDQIAAAYGRIDVLVNNSGIAVTGFTGRDLDSIERELTVNLLSPLYVTRLAVDLLRRSDDPRVISTVSLGGIFPLAETPVYCAAKFGLRGAMHSLALDWKPQGISVSCVLPSATDTRMLRQEALDGGSALQFQHPPQTTDNVVRAVLSLLDRPRLEAYPKPGESRLVRTAMTIPNLLFTLQPFFQGKGEAGREAYIRRLIARGDVIDADGHLELAP